MSQINFFKIQQIDYNKLESKLVSIILCTFREKPKFELLYKTLSQQTIKNFEVVIADYLYDKRKDQIKKLSEKYHIPTVHVERDKFGVHAFNVGIVHSAGDYMIHINDANYFPYRFIEKHMLVCTNNFLSLGARYFAFSINFPIGKHLTAQIEVPEKQEKKISNKINKRSQIEKYLYLNFGEHQIISPQDFRLLGLPNDLITSENILLEALPGWSYGGSIAGPTELFLELNGFDEEYDKGYGWSDCDIGVRAFNKGYKSFINPSNWCLEIQDQDHNIVFDILPEYKLKKSSEHNWKLYEESCEKMKTRVNPEINLREEREKILKLRSEKK